MLLTASALTPALAQMPQLVRLIVPYPPGGSVDLTARMLQQPLQAQLKTTVVVENRPGAGGRIAASQAKREAADGSFILIAPNALTTIQSLVYAGKLDYSVTADLIPVARIASYPFGLAVPATSPVKNLTELKSVMEKNRSDRSFGTSGAGGMAHFAGLTLGKKAGIDWVHVPFKGGAPLITDLIGGHVPVGLDTLVDQIEHQRSGKIRILGTFSAQRSDLAPEIPTLNEQGVSLSPVEGWFGAFVSSRVSKDVVAQLDQAIGKVMADPVLKDKLNKMMLSPSYVGSADFVRLQAAELEQWAPVVRDSGFKPD